ncbi:MAG: PDZ domain-containing protein [Calditrichales bacterium]|nr:MAG: PDZ domain-containing protein [Calditrichales bacterium]
MRYIIIILLFVNLSMSAETLQKQILTAKQKVLPALVHIEPVKEVFSDGKRMKMQVTGSGIIFSPDGYILTNNHVAEKARQVFCTLSNREEVRAEVVGLDALTDLAVLKLDLSDKDYDTVEFATFGDSDSLEVGEIVMALGSPLGLSRSLSMGVISSIDRYFEDIGEMVSPFNLWIQTDAAINPGNSGGPLINIKGEVIGINARSIFFGENLGFAIPINTAKLVIERILRDSTVERSEIGIDLQEIKDYRKYKRSGKMEGVLIAHVDENSVAEMGGLIPGDLVTKINDKPVSAVYKEELPKIRKFIAEIPVGEEISFDFQRDGLQNHARIVTTKRGKFEGNEFECGQWGLSVKEITPRVVNSLKLKDDQGVLVSGILSGGPAEEAEVFRGYVIQYVDNQKITDLEQFKSLYEKTKNLPPKGRMLRLFSRNATIFALLREE